VGLIELRSRRRRRRHDREAVEEVGRSEGEYGATVERWDRENQQLTTRLGLMESGLAGAPFELGGADEVQR
jgi:hypothetical protein